MAVFIDELRLVDVVTAEEITHIDLGEAFRSRFRNPYAVVHRGELHGIFLQACKKHALANSEPPAKSLAMIRTARP